MGDQRRFGHRKASVYSHRIQSWNSRTRRAALFCNETPPAPGGTPRHSMRYTHQAAPANTGRLPERRDGSLDQNWNDRTADPSPPDLTDQRAQTRIVDTPAAARDGPP